MDIDKLFKVPKLPVGGNKRKLPDNPTPEMLKKMKMDTSSTSIFPDPIDGTSNLQRKQSSRSVRMEEVKDEDDYDTSFAPGGDADYFAEEDDEGRFFGGGLTSEQKEILNIFDGAKDDDADENNKFSVTGIRRLFNHFDKAVKKNQDHRSKYPTDPSKFIDSEADLDTAIKQLLPLAQYPTIAYPELINSGAITLLIELLSHENIDIVIDVVELIHELTDEDVENELEETEEDTDSALKVLVDQLVEHSILDLLVDNLARMNEEEESDRLGIFHVLGIFENILSISPELSTTFGCKTRLLPWLLARVESKSHDENGGYAAELLSILLQNNKENKLQFGHQDGVEVLLKVLSKYRKRDPSDADETEFMENIFDILCSALSEASIKELFLKAEGADLMVMMMREKLLSKSRSIKTLDYAMSGSEGSAVCEVFIEALGLKALFSTFMGKDTKKHKTKATLPASEDTAHTLGIISSLLTNLASESPGRIRLLAKFVEKNYEKVDKLLEIRDTAQQRLKVLNLEIESEKKEMSVNGDEITPEDEDGWYLRRLDNGLFTLQTVDYILAWLIMEDDGIRQHALQMLSRKNLSVEDILDTLKLYYENVDEPEITPNTDQSSPTQKEILQNLIAALDTKT